VHPNIHFTAQTEHWGPDVVGSEALNRALLELLDSTVGEISTFSPGRALSRTTVIQSKARNKAVYERGIRSRTIYLNGVRKSKPTMEYVRWLNERGSEVRTLPYIPIRMIIFDNTTAVLPVDPNDDLSGFVIHRDPSILCALLSLFESFWFGATPLGMTIPSNGEYLSMSERVLVETLSLGRIDKEIGKQMGISERTVARRVAEIMARLNATTRFQAGVKAAKKNWL
jgi:DNA-binding CsgD family transcriptional regulator